MQNLNVENVKSVDDIFNKTGELNNEEVEEAKKFLEEENENGEKKLAEFYSDLFKKVETQIKLMLKIELVLNEGKLNISNKSINKALNRFNELYKVERELNINIANAMLKHYNDPTAYRYEPKNLFLICLVGAFKSWSEERRVEESRIVNLEEIESRLKNNKVANEDTYVDALIGILRIAGSYYDRVAYENKRERFKTNPEEFIYEALNNIPLDEKSIEGRVGIIAERIYGKLNISGELPPFDTIITILPAFPAALSDAILGFRWTNYKLNVIALASLFSAIKNTLDNIGGEDPKISKKMDEISDEMARLMNNNKITEYDINKSKEFLGDLSRLLEDLKKAKRNENLMYT